MGKGLRSLLWVLAVVGLLAALFGLLGMFGEKMPRGVRDAAPWSFLLGLLALLVAIGAALTLRGRIVAGYRVALLQLLAAAVRRGRPPAQALSALSDDYPKPLRLRTWRLLNELDRGLPLSGALEVGGRGLLSPAEIGLLRAAEGGPRLGAVLDGLVEREQRRRRSSEGTSHRLLYPLFVFGLGSLVAFLTVPEFCIQLERLKGWRGYDPAVIDGALAALAPALGARWAALALLLVSAGGVVGMLLLEASRRRFFPVRWLSDRVAVRPGGGVLPMDRAELLCRALAAAAWTGLPLDGALDRAAPAGGRGPGEAAVRAAAVAVRGGEPAERAFAATRLPPWVVVRLAAAAAAPPERFGAAAEALAEECGRRRRDRAALLSASIHPATLILGGLFAILLLSGILAAYHRIVLDLGTPR